MMCGLGQGVGAQGVGAQGEGAQGAGAQGVGAQGKRGQEVMGGGSRRVVKREEWGKLCHIAQNLAIAKKVHRRGSEQK